MDLASHMWEKYGQSLLTLWGASLVLGVSCGEFLLCHCLCGLRPLRWVALSAVGVCVLVPVPARGWVTVFTIALSRRPRRRQAQAHCSDARAASRSLSGAASDIATFSDGVGGACGIRAAARHLRSGKELAEHCRERHAPLCELFAACLSASHMPLGSALPAHRQFRRRRVDDMP